MDENLMKKILTYAALFPKAYRVRYDPVWWRCRVIVGGIGRGPRSTTGPLESWYGPAGTGEARHSKWSKLLRLLSCREIKLDYLGSAAFNKVLSHFTQAN